MDLEPIAGRGIAHPETLPMAPAERVALAELIRRRGLVVDRQGRLPVATIQALLEEVRGAQS